MIAIKNILLYFYNFISPKNIIFDEYNKYFKYNSSYYILKKVNSFDINFINYIERNNLFSVIIKNKFNNIISNYNNINYALIKIRVKEDNRDITFNDLVYISNIYINIPIIKINYYVLWIKKIDFIEKYAKDCNMLDYDINYYLGLSTIATNMIENVDFNNITYKFSFNRFYNINCLYDLLDPFNIKYGPCVNSLSEYIKYSYFYKHKKVDYNLLFNLNLNIDDYYLFISRLIFPTYFFDLLNQNDISSKYLNIINNIDGYILYIKEIFEKIKRRYSKLSSLEIIFNQL